MTMAAVLSSQGHVGKHVAVLLCTYDGERFISAQLDSIAAQTHREWSLWVSDDGSTDGTMAVLKRYQNLWGTERIMVRSGPGIGFVENFLSLTCNAEIDAAYYAYSDQDDVWEADKLGRALAWLETVAEHKPALYCGRTRLVDDNNQSIGMSPLFSKPPSFENALVQSIAGGNTMVFNRAARDLLIETSVIGGVVSHDWWVYLVVSGCGGQIFYDPVPSIRYRQHNDNLVGSNTQWGARFARIRWLMHGRLRTWSTQHIAALVKSSGRLTTKNLKTFNRFASARQQRTVRRIIGLASCKIYRQTFLGNLGLIVAALLKKI